MNATSSIAGGSLFWWSEEDRASVAGACVLKLGIEFPAVLNEFGNGWRRARCRARSGRGRYRRNADGVQVHRRGDGSAARTGGRGATCCATWFA